MSGTASRRQFLQWSAGTSLATYAAVAAAQQPAGANERIVMGVMGVNGRGSALARGFAGRPGVEVAYICDVDSRAVTQATSALREIQPKVPVGVGDFRRILDDPSVDVLVVATPNHWHAPATILACSANKHVYVEKPCSHTAEEGELAIAAARKHNRVVTMGTQRRSQLPMMEAMEKLQQGDIGTVRYARSWYASRRGTIGRGARSTLPSGSTTTSGKDLHRGAITRTT